MIINFRIHFKTSFGERIRIKFTEDQEFLSGFKYREFITYDGENWIAQLIYEGEGPFYYKYEVLKNREIREEGLKPRVLDRALKKGLKSIHIRDYWKATDSSKNVFYSSAFTEILLKRTDRQPAKTFGAGRFYLEFNLAAPDIPQDAILGVAGNHPQMGNWSKPLTMGDENYPVWSVGMTIDESHLSLEYKYVLIDKKSGEVRYWEAGPNRRVEHQFADDHGYGHICNDEQFRFASPWWKAAGIAIPVFSLRSRTSFGIGDFNDLKKLIDFSAACKLKMVQILPVNDTIAHKTWTDSYPYAAISVFALHPIYLYLPAMGKMTKKDAEAYEAERMDLNALNTVDFEKVLHSKLRLAEKIFNSQAKKLSENEDFQQFKNKNAWWVRDYAAFCALRDYYATPDFSEWAEFAVYDRSKIDALEADANWNKKMDFYTFVQYHLDKQLGEARAYGKSKNLVLKGDLPIGIYRYSCDAWTQPGLYHMDQQAGAPPDDYAVNGQNWGFPTYNWKEMSLNHFEWWRLRMQKLAEYFDALRIDHILGFFRIWSIPFREVTGTLGKFNPRLPYSQEDLAYLGLKGDINRFTKPYIRRYMVQFLFGAEAHFVIENYLDEVFQDAFMLKPMFQSQKDVYEYFESQDIPNKAEMAQNLAYLLTEVLLLEEEGDVHAKYNPRITLHTTYSYRDLDEANKRALDKIYTEYFYNRHSQFWKEQALWKLPVLIKATDMLICGEDLGMIPSTVPEVMEALNILTLEIQRMPKGNALFGDCSAYPYESVCSPSCHDMSTIRGWWEGNVGTSQTYYHRVLQGEGSAPRVCSGDIVEAIVKDHLQSPSMFAIFPIQDLMGMDESIRKEDSFSEQINEPANPKHYWRYRMHVDIESLTENENFCEKIRAMVHFSNR